MKKTFFSLLAITFVLLLPSSAHASAYVISLFYNANTKTLTFDKMAEKNVTLDDKIHPDYLSFAQNETQGSYTLSLYNASGADIMDTKFNRQNGAFTLIIPYFSLATNLKIFENSTGKELLSADFSALSTCNGNGICEYEKGETAQNCLGDCATSHPVFSQPTSDLLKQNNGVIKDTNTGDILLKDPALIPSGQSTTSTASNSVQTQSQPNYLLLILAIVLIVAILGYFIYKKFIKK